MADRPNRPQPFRFWLPFWVNPSLTPLRPPIPTRQQPLPQTPASTQLPPSQTQQTSPRPTPQLAIQKASRSPLPTQGASQTQPAVTRAGPQLLSQPLPPSSPPKSPIGSTSPLNKPELLSDETQPLVQTLSQTQGMNPIQPASASKPTENQPAQVIESKPKPVSSLEKDFPAEIDATSDPNHSLSEKETKKTKEENSRTIPETKLDKQPGKLLESEENCEPASKEQPETKAEGNQGINPTKNPESDRTIEGFNEDKSKTEPEIEPQKPQTEAGDELKKRNESKPSSIASDTKRTTSPPKAGEIIAELRISKPEHSKKQDNVAGEESAQNGSSGKESKIAISTMPWASYSDGELAVSEKIKEGRSRLVQKLDVGERIDNGQPVRMITLAGENNGASMVIGTHTHVHRGLKHPKGNAEACCGNVEEKWMHICTENRAITTSINSNAQSINNSALHDSCCNARDPGVHLNLSSNKVVAASPREQTEPLKPQKTAPRLTPVPTRSTPEQKPSHEPRIRRRCLRALFMESSDSDPENLQKPRRHGCRFCCDEKKKGKAAIDATSTANGNARARQAEEGTSRA